MFYSYRTYQGVEIYLILQVFALNLWLLLLN